MNNQQELINAINSIQNNRNAAYDTPAEVLRVDGDTVWVHIDGGADETPVLKTINCEQGEKVQVRISNGSAFLVGNASAPPTDDKRANVAHFVAVEADEKADTAIKSVDALSQTVESKIDSGDSNIVVLSSTMYQNANGVNIYNGNLAVGDSYAHIDGDSFDIKNVTTAGTIDDTNDTLVASFGREVTVGTRASGSTVGNYSQVYGWNCTASGIYSQAMGYMSQATGKYAHAEGIQSYANGNNSHSEGSQNYANGICSHAEGFYCFATGDYSHTEGRETQAKGYASHSEGVYSKAEGSESHAEGNHSHAKSQYSHAQNLWTYAYSEAQTTMGKYNIADSNNTYALIIGNGSDDDVRSDALRVDWSGNILIDGTLKDLSGNNLLDEWTPAVTASTSGSNVVAVFDNLDDSYGYFPYFEDELITVTAVTKGTGTQTGTIKLTYTLQGATSGTTQCYLRIMK